MGGGGETDTESLLSDTLKKNQFIYFGCARSSLPCGLFSSCEEQELLSSCSAYASHCSGFSSCGAQGPGTRTSAVAACGLISCGAQAWLPLDQTSVP